MPKKRKHGTGTIRLRKDGRWEGRIVVGYKDNGNPITKNVLAKTKVECTDKLEKLKSSLDKTVKFDENITLGEWIDYWYNTYKKNTIKPKTQRNYENRIYCHIIPSIGNIELKKLTPSDLQQFYAKLKSNGRITRNGSSGSLSNQTVRGCYITCKAALERAVTDGIIKTNPSSGCKAPPKKAREMKVLTAEEIQRFLIQAKCEGYYELFLLELSTGLRRGEVLGLKWSDLNFNTGELQIKRQATLVDGDILITEPKTKSSLRTIVLPQSVLNVLREYKKEVNSQWLFPSPIKDDMPLNPAAVRKRLKIILERAECKTVRFHDLRHTFATMALENGMDIKTLSAIIGHISSATTLDVYSHITDNMKRQAAAKIDCGVAHTDAEIEPICDKKEEVPTKTTFKPKSGKIRKSGTGCISKISENLYEGRYSPKVNGKRITRNIYAHTREECEQKLAVMIDEMKAEISEMKSSNFAPQ